jgi:hypothetical protein
MSDATQSEVVKCWGSGSIFINGQANSVRLGDTSATTPDKNPIIKYVAVHCITFHADMYTALHAYHTCCLRQKPH